MQREDTPETAQDARRAVMARIETGNFGDAATLLTEYAEVYPLSAAAIRSEVKDAYNIEL